MQIIYIKQPPPHEIPAALLDRARHPGFQRLRQPVHAVPAVVITILHRAHGRVYDIAEFFQLTEFFDKIRRLRGGRDASADLHDAGHAAKPFELVFCPQLLRQHVRIDRLPRLVEQDNLVKKIAVRRRIKRLARHPALQAARHHIATVDQTAREQIFLGLDAVRRGAPLRAGLLFRAPGRGRIGWKLLETDILEFRPRVGHAAFACWSRFEF
jgi:hypothetical protein